MGYSSKIHYMMKERGVQKVPGYSWTEVDNSTHIFVAADASHPQSAEIYLLLDNLLMELQNEGYVPHIDRQIQDSLSPELC